MCPGVYVWNLLQTYLWIWESFSGWLCWKDQNPNARLEDRKINWPMDAASLLLLGGWTNPFELNMRTLNWIISAGFGVKRKNMSPIGYQISQTLNVRMVYLPATMVGLAFANVNVGTYSTYMKSAWDWFELPKDTVSNENLLVERSHVEWLLFTASGEAPGDLGVAKLMVFCHCKGGSEAGLLFSRGVRWWNSNGNNNNHPITKK